MSIAHPRGLSEEEVAERLQVKLCAHSVWRQPPSLTRISSRWLQTFSKARASVVPPAAFPEQEQPALHFPSPFEAQVRSSDGHGWQVREPG